MFDVSNETHFYDQLKVLLFPLPIAIFCSLIAVFLHTSYLEAYVSVWKIFFQFSVLHNIRYGDSAGNTVEENSSVFSLIWMC